MQISNLKVTQFKVKYWVIVPVPVPIGPSDSANIIAMATEPNNELNRLGTKHRLIKEWFNSSILQSITSNFINLSEVNKVKELSLRKIVALTTRGKVY